MIEFRVMVFSNSTAELLANCNLFKKITRSLLKLGDILRELLMSHPGLFFRKNDRIQFDDLRFLNRRG